MAIVPPLMISVLMMAAPVAANMLGAVVPAIMSSVVMMSTLTGCHGGGRPGECQVDTADNQYAIFLHDCCSCAVSIRQHQHHHSR
jgi:hypothetical protein